MFKAVPKKQNGFTLIEMLMVILIIAATTKIVAVSMEDFGYAARYEQTQERLNTLRQAIIGNPKRTINGQPDISGFVSDMGRLPNNIRELIQRYGDCDNDAYDYSQIDCEGNGGNWLNTWSNLPASFTHNATGMMFGWNGPYLNVSDNPSSTDTYTDGWGNESANNYGWISCLWDDVDDSAGGGLSNNLPNDTDAIPDGLANCSNTQLYPNFTIYTLGKNGVGNVDSDGLTGCGGSDYNGDCYTSILQNDYTVNISAGISVSFIKPLSSSIPVDSFCSDPSKITKNSCEANNPDTGLPYGEWFGGCSEAGYINKSTCVSAGKQWYSCHINTLDNDDAGYSTCSSPNCYKTKTSCLNANGIWFGEGYGCDNAAKSDQATCTVSNTWRSCTDDGTITTSSACEAADEIWYGDNIVNKQLLSVSVKKYQAQKICLRLFYRKTDSSIDIGNDSSFVTITEDGSSQTINFSGFSVSEIPMGINAIGIYEHDGTSCTNTLYPSDRTQPIQVQFIPHSNLPIINW